MVTVLIKPLGFWCFRRVKKLQMSRRLCLCASVRTAGTKVEHLFLSLRSLRSILCTEVLLIPDRRQLLDSYPSILGDQGLHLPDISCTVPSFGLCCPWFVDNGSPTCSEFTYPAMYACVTQNCCVTCLQGCLDLVKCPTHFDTKVDVNPLLKVHRNFCHSLHVDAAKKTVWVSNCVHSAV